MFGISFNRELILIFSYIVDDSILFFVLIVVLMVLMRFK